MCSFVNELETELMAQAADALRRRGADEAAARAYAALGRLREVRRGCDCAAG